MENLGSYARICMFIVSGLTLPCMSGGKGKLKQARKGIFFLLFFMFRGSSAQRCTYIKYGWPCGRRYLADFTPLHKGKLIISEAMQRLNSSACDQLISSEEQLNSSGQVQ